MTAQIRDMVTRKQQARQVVTVIFVTVTTVTVHMTVHTEHASATADTTKYCACMSFALLSHYQRCASCMFLCVSVRHCLC
jgi:hypothetical protein